ncbi:MAG: hypothetical protein ABIQ70_03505 [Dokdonella sp.]
MSRRISLSRCINHAATFIDTEDLTHYRALLDDIMACRDLPVRACALMSNPVHRLITPTRAGDLAHAVHLPARAQRTSVLPARSPAPDRV